MKASRFPVVLAGVCSLTILLAAADSKPDPEKIEYGKYIVEEVSRCQDCHTPRLENGEFDKSKWMKGTLLEFGPLKPGGKWHKDAPDITGTSKLWARWGDDGMRKFMKTALNPRGHEADAPMPQYHMKDKEADAVTAYLKSLK